jgi:ATP-dependent helicase/nuclease subunit B
VIPAGKTKSGYSKASKMLLPEEFDAVLTYAEKRRTDLQGAMYRGKAEALPYEMGTQNGCAYCPYRDICGFDEQIEGYEYRKLEKLPKEIVMEKIMAKLEEDKFYLFAWIGIVLNALTLLGIGGIVAVGVYGL